MARAANNSDAIFSAELGVVLEAARGLAGQGGASATEPAHLACAMLAPGVGSDGSPTASRAAELLSHLDFDVAALHRAALAAIAADGGTGGRAKPSYSSQATLAIAKAGALAMADGASAEVTSAHLLMALVDGVDKDELDPLWIVDRLESADVSLPELRAKWAQMRRVASGQAPATALDEHAGVTSPDFISDLTADARAGKLDPIIGRDAEIERVIRILSRRTKNNAALLGQAGVGKTAIAEGLAQRIVAGNVPKPLLRKRILAFSAAGIVAGTKYRGDFEARILPFLRSVRDDPDVVLFIDELHTIVGAGTGGMNESGDLSTIMKPMLARGELRCVGATTLDDYRKYIESDTALERRFQPVSVREPTPQETLAILEGIVGRYSAFHRVSYPEAILEACVSLAGRHLPDRRFPDKAIDVMDESGTKASLDGRSEVSLADVLATVAGMANTTSEALATDPETGSLATRLSPRIIGQPEAVVAVSTVVESRRLALTERTAPLAAFVFVGPTGSGKSALAAALAEAEFEGVITNIDLANFADKISVTGLIGAPPSYIGFDEPSRLVEPVRRRGAQVVLLRHADAAAPEVRALLAEVLRTGTLTDTHDRTASFRDAVVIFTVTDAGGGGAMGFRGPAEPGAAAAAAETRMRTLLGSELVDLVDAVVPFAPLDEEALEAIAEAQLAEIRASLARRHHIELAMSPAVRKAVVARVGRAQGARPIRRAVERLVEHPVAAAFAKPNRRSGRYTMDVESGDVVVRRSPEADEVPA